MHLSLEDMNCLLEDRARDDERAVWMDHVIECAVCAPRFKAMHALQQQMVAQSITSKIRHPLRYALGAAAVLALGLSPYLVRKEAPPEQQVAFEVPAQVPFPEPLNPTVLDKVAEINYRTALAQWGSGTDLTDLVTIKNHRP